MCHILVVNHSILSVTKKREFELETRMKIRKVKTNPSIKIIYGDKKSRKIKRQIQNFRRKHPGAKVQNVEPVEEVAMAS